MVRRQHSRNTRPGLAVFITKSYSCRRCAAILGFDYATRPAERVPVGFGAAPRLPLPRAVRYTACQELPHLRFHKAVITAAGPDQRALPLQSLIDRDGREKSVLGILIEQALAAGVDEICVVVWPGDEARGEGL